MSRSITDHDVAQAMIKHGGGFASALGQTWLKGDRVNRMLIAETWPDLWIRYSNIADREAERELASHD